MKALVGAFNQEKALVGAFSVIVQLVVEPMEHYTQHWLQGGGQPCPRHHLDQERGGDTRLSLVNCNNTELWLVVQVWSFKLSEEDMSALDGMDSSQPGQNTMAGWLREHDPDYYY